MNQTVSVLSMTCMGLSGLIAFLLPVGCFICFRKKGADILPFPVGCLVMLLFAFVLESLAHQVILSSAAGDKIRNNLWLYALYGGFMAGLFEETGRLAAFRTVLKKRRDRDVNALMYGAGHGGFEAVVLLGITSVNNLIWSFMINSGNREALTGNLTGETLQQVENSIQALITTPAWLFLMGGLERILAVILQISLSVLVWFAAKKGGIRWYFLAVLIHLAVDAAAVILSGLGVHAALIEAAVALMALLTALLAGRIWKQERALL